MVMAHQNSLRSAIKWRSKEIILYAFDLLHLNGIDLRRETLLERRTKLRWLLGVDAESRIQFSEEFAGDGDTLLKACAKRKLEGIVSKHAMSRMLQQHAAPAGGKFGLRWRANDSDS